MSYRKWALTLAATLVAVAPSYAADYGPGVNDTEIKIGNTLPYSGPVSAYGTVGRLELAYYEMVNSQGGVNGRKIKLLSLDDAYSPAKAVEQTRRLVEQDEVLAIIGQVGTITSSAVQKYLNARKVPQILIASGAAKWDDPKNLPFSTSLYPSYQMEGHIFARYLIGNKPNAKLGIFSQNDDAGKDYVKGLKDGLGSHAAAMIIKELTYETSEPTIDSQVVALKASGADTVFLMATPKFGAQAIRKIAELNWKPLVYIAGVTASIETVLKPAGLENSKGLMSAFAFKRPDDPRWENDTDVKEYKAFLQRWYPAGHVADSSNVLAYITAYVTTEILALCGDNLTRENLLKQATNLSNLKAPLLLPGITITTTPQSYTPIRQMQIGRFDGASWVMEGALISTDIATR